MAYKGGLNMSIMERRINNVMKAMKNAKDYGAKHIWSKHLQALFKIRERQAYERLQDSARSVH
tara:strand:+ start:48 stop:236 length:189 start_codon:yes stop_codon:yes gene_type:complete